ncbi:MAG: DNA replication/repair protein RecF [Paracoccaceae bacterium]
MLRAIRLSHFRSHRSLSLEGDGRPVALCGPNGAGKTNILEAISMLSPGRGLRRAAAENLIRRPEAIGWKITALIETGGDAHEIVTAVTAPGERRTVEIDGKSAPQSALGALAPMLWLTPAMDRLWAEGPGERRRFLDRITLNFDPGHGERTLAYERAMRERNRLLVDRAPDPGWLTALEAQMAAAGAAIARARAEAVARLSAVQHGAEGVFPRAILSLEGVAEAGFLQALSAGTPPDELAAEVALAEALARGRRADAAAGRTLAGPHRSDLVAVHEAKGVEAKLASTGEQKALLIALILATTRALAAERGAPPLLLLDEIAAHLDDTRRAALYDEIVAIGADVWMTGTGPELFDALGPRGRLVTLGET